MSALVTFDVEFLLFTILLFMFDLISLKEKMVTVLNLGLSSFLIISGFLATELTDNYLFGMLGLLMVIFSFAVSVANLINLAK